VAQNDDYILEILLETGLITKSQLERARNDRKGDDTVIGMLINQGALSQEDVTRALAGHAAMGLVDLSALTINEEVIQMVPREVAKRFKVIPIVLLETGLMIAIGDPLNFDTFDTLHHMLHRDLEFVCATPDAIATAFRKYYGTGTKRRMNSPRGWETSRSPGRAAAEAPKVIRPTHRSSRWYP